MKTRLLLCLMFLLSFRLFSQPVESPYPNSRFLVVDSVRIHYRTWNDLLAHPKGKVLLIHGFCGSTFCWRNNWDTLVASGYKVVAVDLPGFGYSQRSATINQSQSFRARLLWKLLEQADGGDTTRWNIVGHSMGGGTAEAMALTEPGRTKTLTILAGMLFIKNDNLSQSVVGLVNLPVYKKLLLSYTKKNYLTFGNLRRELKSAYGFLPDSLTTLGYYASIRIDGTAETVVNLLANSREIRPLDAHGLSGRPVLVIWGRKDRTIPLINGRRFKKVIPSVELRVIPNCHHMAMETHPGVFNAMLVEFLDRYNH